MHGGTVLAPEHLRAAADGVSRLHGLVNFTILGGDSNAFHVAVMDHVVGILADQLGLRPAQQALCLGIDKSRQFVAVYHEDALAQSAGDFLQLCFALENGGAQLPAAK